MSITNFLILFCLLNFAELSLQEGFSLFWTAFQREDRKSFVLKMEANPNGGGFDHSEVVIEENGIFRAITSDPANDTIFYQSFGESNFLGVYNLQTKKTVKYFQGMMENVNELAFDWLSRNLYWSDNKLGLLMVVDPTLTRYRVLYRTTGDDEPFGLTIHPIERYLFFSVVGSNSPGIMRCDLACQDPEHIVDTNDVTSLTADSERLYWTEFTSYGSRIMRSNLDGTGAKRLVGSNQALFKGMASFQDYVYVSDDEEYTDNSGDKTGYTGSKYSKMVMFIFGSKRPQYFTLKKKPQKVTFYTKTRGYQRDEVKSRGECDASPKCDHICLPRLNEVRLCQCAEGYSIHGDTECRLNPINDNYLLVVDWVQQKVFQLPLNATGDHPYQVLPIDPKYDNTVTTMALNQKTRTLYWSNDQTATIYKQPVNSTDAIVVKEGIHARSIAVDQVAGNIYVVDDESGFIYVMDESGNYSKTLIRPLLNMNIEKVVLDVKNRYLYWLETTNYVEGRINRMQLGATGWETVIDKIVNTKSFDINYSKESLLYLKNGNSIIEVPLSALSNGAQPNPSSTKAHTIEEITDDHLVTDFKMVGDTIYFTERKDETVRSYIASRSPHTLRFGTALFYRPTTLEIYRSSYYQRYIAPLPNPCANAQCQELCLVTSPTKASCACGDGKRLVGTSICVSNDSKIDRPPSYGDSCPSDSYVYLLPCEKTIPLYIRSPNWTDDNTAFNQLQINGTSILPSYGPGSYDFHFTATDQVGNIGHCLFTITVQESQCHSTIPRGVADIQVQTPRCVNGEFIHEFSCADPDKSFYLNNTWFKTVTSHCLSSGQWSVVSIYDLTCTVQPTTSTATTTTTTIPTTTTTAQTPRITTTRKTTKPTTTTTTTTVTTKPTTTTHTTPTTKPKTTIPPTTQPTTTTTSTTKPKTTATTTIPAAKTKEAPSPLSKSTTTNQSHPDQNSTQEQPQPLLANNGETKDQNRGLGGGAIAGIVIVCVILAAVLVGAGFIIRRRFAPALSDNSNGFKLFWNSDESNYSKHDPLSD